MDTGFSGASCNVETLRAGHGIQANGENYLIPVNADIKSVADLQYEALNVQQALDKIQEAGNGLNIIVLDACRNLPSGLTRSGERGLKTVDRQPPGSIIVYATGAGQTADDSSGGRNGLFTGHLLNNLKNRELEVFDLFRQTMADVSRASGNKQIPAIYTQVPTRVYLGGRPAPQPVPPGRVYRIGDRGPGGGIVFFAGGNSYMEVSEFLGDLTWENAISAAGNYRGGGYSGWRLPTKEELNLVWQNLVKNKLVSMNDPDDLHWSSSEYSSALAWRQRFSDGAQGIYGKPVTYSVRAVRAF